MGPLDLAGGTALMIRRLIVPLTMAVVTFHAGQGFAQGAFPAPLPGQAPVANDPAFPPVPGQAPAPRSAIVKNDPAFPPVNGASPGSFPVNGAAPLSGGFGAPAGPSQGGPPPECMKDFLPLREETAKRGKMIQAASARHAPADEACKLIQNFSQAEVKMIKYVEGHSNKCGIPAQISDQLKNGHKNTEKMQQQVCGAAAQGQQQRGPAGPSLSEVLGSATAVPEATPTKRGGSTFDTLNGNVLTR
jgi:hypothetical protein